jgi:hypothetical protein
MVALHVKYTRGGSVETSVNGKEDATLFVVSMYSHMSFFWEGTPLTAMASEV